MNQKVKKDVDPVEEVRAIRDRYAKKFNYDIDAILKDVAEREKKSKRKFAASPSKSWLKNTGS